VLTRVTKLAKLDRQRRKIRIFFTRDTRFFVLLLLLQTEKTVFFVAFFAACFFLLGAAIFFASSFHLDFIFLLSFFFLRARVRCGGIVTITLVAVDLLRIKRKKRSARRVKTNKKIKPTESKNKKKLAPFHAKQNEKKKRNSYTIFLVNSSL